MRFATFLLGQSVRSCSLSILVVRRLFLCLLRSVSIRVYRAFSSRLRPVWRDFVRLSCVISHVSVLDLACWTPFVPVFLHSRPSPVIFVSSSQVSLSVL